MLKKDVLEEAKKKWVEGSFNISKIAYRINQKGELSEKPVSRKVKDKTDHPYFNFSESGKVLVRSGRQDSFQIAVRTFQAVHEVLVRTLDNNEYLWEKELLLTDQEAGVYFTFAFQSDFNSQMEKESLFQYIESIASQFSDNFYNQLGISRVKAKDSEIEVKFNLNYRESESIDFRKMETAYYILLSFLFYEEDSSVHFSNHVSAFFDAWGVPTEVKNNLEQLTANPLSVPEEKEEKKVIIEELEKFYQIVRQKPYQLKGYEEMEISTQMLIFDAIRMGISYELLDEADHMLRLTADGKTEYVQQATRTGLVSYISSIIMENKYVSKLLLKEKNFSVPQASIYADAKEAIREYERYEGKEIVIKPKSTNKGIGISILKPVKNRKDFDKAIERAFLEDSTVLVEEFIAGIEYRFFVINGKCRDVLLRKPANVKGDGKQTIEELVQEKNKDFNRGYDGRAPLEVIKIGDVEQLTLSQQGLASSSIPNKGEVVYLRENSNISTGGDSISFLDEMDDSYLKIAEEITHVLDADVCGVDLIIPNYQTPSTENDPGYYFLEANANPGMYAHMFVSEGKGVRLTMHVLDGLFPELDILGQATEVEI